jgi:hypothetical protein
MYQKGLQTFVWTVHDPDDVDLEYEVFYRREGEDVWRPLKRGLWEPICVWDTTTVPDGTYVVKIVASDALANAQRTVPAGERERRVRDRQHAAADRTAVSTSGRV